MGFRAKTITQERNFFCNILKCESIFFSCDITSCLSKIFSFFIAITACHNNEHLFFIRYVKKIPTIFQFSGQTWIPRKCQHKWISQHVGRRTGRKVLLAGYAAECGAWWPLFIQVGTIYLEFKMFWYKKMRYFSFNPYDVIHIKLDRFCWIGHLG